MLLLVDLDFALLGKAGALPCMKKTAPRCTSVLFSPLPLSGVHRPIASMLFCGATVYCSCKRHFRDEARFSVKSQPVLVVDTRVSVKMQARRPATVLYPQHCPLQEGLQRRFHPSHSRRRYERLSVNVEMQDNMSPAYRQRDEIAVVSSWRQIYMGECRNLVAGQYWTLGVIIAQLHQKGSHLILRLHPIKEVVFPPKYPNIINSYTIEFNTQDMMQQSDDVSTGNPKSIIIAAVAQQRASFSASADFTNSLEFGNGSELRTL
jgi:hypothetical protein